jgi:hypothetical protein
MNMLGLLEAFDRAGALLGRLSVKQWPVTVGRGLACDLVLDDPYIAEGHLRIERGPAGEVTVEVLDTRNGVTLKQARHARGARFEWPAGEELVIGRVRLVLRLADAPIAPEQPLPSFPWARIGFTVSVLAALLALQLGRGWLEATETRRFLQQLPFAALYLLGSVALWAGLWALVTKVFSGRLRFWRHVRIACVTFIASQVLVLLAFLLGFMFSWESLPKFAWIGMTVLAAVGVACHVLVIAPRRRVLVGSVVAALLLLGIPGVLGTQWLQNKRLSNELYMASFFPPSWRLASTVTVPQFMGEAGGLRERLDMRLTDREDDVSAPAASADDEE